MGWEGWPWKRVSYLLHTIFVYFPKCHRWDGPAEVCGSASRVFIEHFVKTVSSSLCSTKEKTWCCDQQGSGLNHAVYFPLPI